MYQVGDNYSIKVIQDFGEFRKLKDMWSSLVDSRSHAPWLSWDWFNLCLKYFLEANKLFILLTYKADRIVSVAPFIIRHEKFKGIIPTKKIELIGNFHSPVRKFIYGNSNNGEKHDNLSALFDFLQYQYKNWDVIELDSIPEEDPTYSILKNVISEHGLRNKEYFCFGDWYLDGINYSGDEYIKRLSKNTRSGTGKKKRRMEKTGNLEFQISTDSSKLDYHLDLYQQVRKKSWKHPEKDVAFLKDYRRMIAERETLKFGFLFFNGTPIAILFGIISNKIAYLLEVVYDLGFEQFSPGEVLHGELIKNLINVDGVSEIDAMRGDEPYKKSWTPQRRERKGFLIFNKTLKGRVLEYLMTRILPIFEKNQYLLSAKNKLSGYLKKYH